MKACLKVRELLSLSAVVALGLVAGCRGGPEAQSATTAPTRLRAGDAFPPTMLYVGSSTIANFLREAEPVYGKVKFVLDTVPESVGGEAAVRERLCDLAGTAMEPAEETRAEGVQVTLLGTDTIAVLVHPTNPLSNITITDLRRVFTGSVTNWKEIGGPNRPLVPMIVGPKSATGIVFRTLVLQSDDYAGCRLVTPDPEMPKEVEEEPGAIGILSFSFACASGAVKLLRVDGQPPAPSNLGYPLVRPLHLLWWSDNPRAADFAAWCGTDDGEKVLLKCFDRPRILRGPAFIGR